MVVGGGQVILEITVDPTGLVTAVAPLRITPPFADLIADAVRGWRFVPAEESAAPARPGELPSPNAVEAKVLVVAVFRPPALTAPTRGELPRDVAAASDEIPFPFTISMPPFPPAAAGSGVVLLEARVNGSGAVTEANVIRSAPPFDTTAQIAVRQWRFRPARVRGTPVSTLVYVIVGFPVPVVNAPTRHR
jgi:TonB family protein